MIHRLFATPNRRVIIALVMVLVVLNALVFFVVRTREMTIARLQLNQNRPNDLTLVTASASTDVQVTLESNITSLPAGGGDVPVKIMVSKPANTVISAMAVNLKYDTAKFTFDRFETDNACNVLLQTTLTLTPIPTRTPPPDQPTPTGAPNSLSFTPQFYCPSGTQVNPAIPRVVEYRLGVIGTTLNSTPVTNPISLVLDAQHPTGYVFVTVDGQRVAPTILPTVVSVSSGTNLTNTWDIGTMFGIPNTLRVWLGMPTGAYTLTYDMSAVSGACVAPTPTSSPVPSPAVAQALSTGNYHTCAIQSGGNLYCWGDNAHQQSTIPAAVVSDVIAVSAGSGHTCAIKSGGQVSCWGDSSNGRTTVPSTVTDAIAVSAGYAHTCAIKSGGQVSCWGDNSAEKATVPSAVASAITVSAGGAHTCAIRSDGQLYCWGSNIYGQTSTPSGFTSTTAVSAGSLHTCAIKSGGQLSCWGDNTFLQATVPNALTNANFVAVSAGFAHTCAIQSSGQLSCWGDNGSGQITIPAQFANVLGANTQASKDNTGLTLVGAGVLDANASSQIVTAVQKTSGDTQVGTTNFCLAKAIFKTKTSFTTLADVGRIEVVASGGDTRIETLPVSGATMGTVEGQQYVEVTKADPGYTIASPAYDVRMTGTVALTIKKPDEQIKRGDEFYIDIMAKPTVPEGAFVGMSALEFDFGYGAVMGADGVPTSKVFITKFDTSQSPECTILEHVLPVVTDGYTVASQRPSIRYSKAGHDQATIPTTDFCVGRIYMKAMETGLTQMSIKTGDNAVALDARGRKMTIQNTNGIASSISLDVVPSTVVDPSCDELKLNVDTNDQQTYVRPQQAVVISMNTGLAYKILADNGTGITLKNPPKRFTYTAPLAEGPDRIQIWRTDNTYCEPEITVQSNANGSVSSLDGVFIDPNKVSVRMKIRPQGVIKGRLPYTKLKVAIAAGGLPTSNNLIDPVSNEFVSIGEGMFEGIITFDPRYIKPGKGYKLVIKGAKHLAKRICEPEPNKSKTKPDSAYSCPKDNAGVFELKNGLNGPYDFTKVYLPAGDLFIERQDGVIDSTDLTYVRKHLGSQDPELLRIGDINMDGQIDTQDYLITISNVVNNLDEN